MELVERLYYYKKETRGNVENWFMTTGAVIAVASEYGFLLRCRNDRRVSAYDVNVHGLYVRHAPYACSRHPVVALYAKAFLNGIILM